MLGVYPLQDKVKDITKISWDKHVLANRKLSILSSLKNKFDVEDKSTADTPFSKLPKKFKDALKELGFEVRIQAKEKLTRKQIKALSFKKWKEATGRTDRKGFEEWWIEYYGNIGLGIEGTDEDDAELARDKMKDEKNSTKPLDWQYGGEEEDDENQKLLAWKNWEKQVGSRMQEDKSVSKFNKWWDSATWLQRHRLAKGLPMSSGLEGTRY